MDQSTFDNSNYNQKNENEKMIQVLHNVVIGLREIKTAVEIAFRAVNTIVSRVQEQIFSVIEESNQVVPHLSNPLENLEQTSVQATSQSDSPSSLSNREQGSLRIGRKFDHSKIQHTSELEDENTVYQRKRIEASNNTDLGTFIQTSYSAMDAIVSCQWDFYTKLQAFSLLKKEAVAKQLEQNPPRPELKKLIFAIVTTKAHLLSKQVRIGGQ